MSPIIAIEEHYITHEIKSLIDNYSSMPAQTHSRLNDHFDLRIKEMDEAGIDIQVLSHNHPGAQIFSPETAADNAMKLNDELATIVSRHPKRFIAIFFNDFFRRTNGYLDGKTISLDRKRKKSHKRICN